MLYYACFRLTTKKLSVTNSCYMIFNFLFIQTEKHAYFKLILTFTKKKSLFDFIDMMSTTNLASMVVNILLIE